MQELVNLLEFVAEAFRCHVHHFQCFTVPVDTIRHSSHNNISAILTTMNRNFAPSSNGSVKHWKWFTWHRKASAKNSSKLNKFLHSEVNLSIQNPYFTRSSLHYKLKLYKISLTQVCFSWWCSKRLKYLRIKTQSRCFFLSAENQEKLLIKW